MQIKTGTVQTTNGSNIVLGLDVEWSQVFSGCLFILDGDSAYYLVTSVNLGASPPQITLNAPFGGATVGTTPGAAYTIVRDFTPAYNLPLMYPGDVETATIFSRAMAILDNVISGGNGGGGGGGGGDVSVDFTFIQANDFAIGTVVRLQDITEDSPGDFTEANSATAIGFRYVGMVTSVTGDTFTLRTGGYVAGIVGGGGLTAGTIYYLRGVGGTFNLTADSGEAGIASPVFIADSPSSGFFLEGSGGSAVMSGASSISAGISGLVPQPMAGDDVKALLGNGTWGSASVADASLTFSALNTDNAFEDANWAAIAPTDSIYNALINLHNRIEVLENNPAPEPVTILAGSSIFGIVNTNIVSIPAAVKRFKFRICGGAAYHMSGSRSAFAYSAGYVEGVITKGGASSLYISAGYASNFNTGPGGSSVIRVSNSSGTILVSVTGGGQMISGSPQGGLGFYPGFMDFPLTVPDGWIVNEGGQAAPLSGTTSVGLATTQANLDQLAVPMPSSGFGPGAYGSCFRDHNLNAIIARAGAVILYFTPGA